MISTNHNNAIDSSLMLPDTAGLLLPTIFLAVSYSHTLTIELSHWRLASVVYSVVL